jgi:hypothetical protein
VYKRVDYLKSMRLFSIIHMNLHKIEYLINTVYTMRVKINPVLRQFQT